MINELGYCNECGAGEFPDLAELSPCPKCNHHQPNSINLDAHHILKNGWGVQAPDFKLHKEFFISSESDPFIIDQQGAQFSVYACEYVNDEFIGAVKLHHSITRDQAISLVKYCEGEASKHQ